MLLMTLCFVVLLAGCSTDTADEYQAERAHAIAGESYKYWRVVDTPTQRRALDFYRFDRNGRWRVYVRDVYGKFAKYDGGDVVLGEIWRLKGSDSIEIGGSVSRMQIVNDSSIVLSYGKLKEKILQANTENLIPKEYLSDGPPE